MGDSDDDFTEQIRLQQICEESEKKGHAKTRVDDDGTVFEWDPIKEAWFPKIDADFLAQYQLNYGNNVSSAATISTSTNPTTTDYSHFYQWYNQNYQTSNSGASNTNTTFQSKEMSEAYNKYLEIYYKDKQNDEKKMNKEEEEYHHAHYYKYYTDTYLPSVNEKDKLDYWSWYAAYVSPGTALNEAKSEDKQKNSKQEKKPAEPSKSEGKGYHLMIFLLLTYFHFFILYRLV